MSRDINISALRPFVNAVLLVVAALFASGAACGQVGRGGLPPGAEGAADPAEATNPGEGNEQTMANDPGTHDPRWKDADRLISEGKFEAAAEIAGEILAAAREAGHSAEETRALIKLVQLRTGLHGYETTVRFLREEPWPETPLSQTALSLFYARTLATYLQSYSWEIGQRERVDTGEQVDLKAWTRDQIHEEIQRVYLKVWNGREAWGDGSLGLLAEYLYQNSYPARIRGTLRDAVTYLWIELLADTSQWRPEHSNAVYRLDLGALLADRPPTVALDDPQVHPLARLATVLGDLEAWHRQRGQPEAAFEARLERIRRLRASFSQAEDLKTLRRRLEDSLDDLSRRYPWWSKGMAELAELVRGSAGRGSQQTASDAEALVEAREIALEGAEAHPQSAGGQHCRHIVAQIEAPSYEISAMAADSPGQRSILIQHRNLEALYFRAYAIDVRRRIGQARDSNLLPGYRDVPGIMASRTPAAEWRVELPPTPDYRSHSTYAVPGVEASGLYLLVASARSDFAQKFNQQTAVNFFLGDLVILHRAVEAGGRPGAVRRAGVQPSVEVEVTVRSGDSGGSLSDVEVDLYRHDYRQGHTLVETRKTGADGRVSFQTEAFSRANHFLLARKGNDAALVQNLRAPRAHRATGTRTSTLIYTDRSVYRPQQKILWKVVAYSGQGDEGRFQVLPEASLDVQLIDANGQQVASSAVTTNAYGSASGEFDIPSGRLLGSWSLRSSFGGGTGVQVEEYKRPTFEAKVIDPASPLRLNRPATLTGEVRYYFGLPVVSGDVAWRVTREPVYPRWGWWRFWPPQPTEVQTVAAGDATLDADGRFEISFTPEADERLSKDVSYRYRLSADVTDEGGETRSASRVFRLGFVAVEATLDSETDYFLSGPEAGEQSVTVRRTDLDGLPRAGRGGWRLMALDQPETALLPADQPRFRPLGDDQGDIYQTPGDSLRPRWETSYDPRQALALWDDGDEISRGSIEHGDDGEGTVLLPELQPGAYRLRYTTTDDFGTDFETRYELLVVAPDTDSSPSSDTALSLPMVLIGERSSVPVGGVARFFIYSGLEDQPMVFELYRAGRRTERRLLSAADWPQLIEVDVGREHRGGFGARLTALRDHQLMSHSADIFLPWDDRELKVEFASFRDRLRPGATETWRVVVRGNDEATLGRGAAEVLAYMYDRSLDVFAPHQPASPLSLYPRRIGIPGVFSSLGQAYRAWQQSEDFVQLPGYPTFSTDRLKFYDGYGTGGPGIRSRRMMKSRPTAMAAPMAAEAAPAPARMEAVAAIADDAAAGVELDESLDVAPQAPTEAEPPAEPELRTDFSETAFWEPHLVTGDDGSVAFELTVPDSVTEWNVWVHAITRDLRAGSLEERTKTVKELLVRPYLPRFFREGDRAHLEVVVNNAGDTELSGELDFEIIDPETEQSLLEEFGLAADDATDVPFTVAAGGGTTLTFPVEAPARVGPVAFRVIGRAGDFSDGELRPLPVLPGRLHLAQSRFVTLHDADRRTLVFEDMEDDDPTRIDEQLVVTLDAQLFYSVLNALPYLASYPYECTEQLLNRFLSTGIVSSLYHKYPSVARMARQFSERETRFESWDENDPNRKMVLEESSWLQVSRGGDAGEDLINVLDPAIAEAQRDASLAKLREAQTAIGGFPWWPGGPPSPYITLYLLQGFSRALEFDVAVPQDVVVKAWSYMHRHYLDKLVRDMIKDDRGWELVTYLNFVLSSYPDVAWTGGVFSDDDRRKMLDFSFKHWRQHSPRLKGYLALLLKREGRDADATLVFDSVMDSAKTTQDEGTFWAPEDRAWLWYNDTIETHAFALRTLTELGPDDARRHGLVQWLLLNKKLNHWKSTRATAEVIYSLVHYLEREGTLGVREAATVTAGSRRETYTFEPDTYAGKTQLVISGDEIDPATMSTIEVEKETPGFMFASATWHFSTEKLPEEARGDFFSVTRKYFKRVNTGREWVLQPLADGAALEPGDQIEVQLSLRSKHAAEYVHLRDPRGAGFEPETTISSYKWDLGIGWYEEVRDSGTNFFFEWLPVGEYTFKYRLRANLAGTFRVGPAQVQSMYAPEFVAYSAGAEVEIVPASE